MLELPKIASQWNSVQRQEFVQGSPIDKCQRVQAVNTGNLIFAFDVVQTAGRNHKCRLPTLFRMRHTCRMNLTHRTSESLTDRPQFCTAICLPLPSTLGHERYYSEPAMTATVNVDLLMEEWCLQESSVKVQGSVRKVLSELSAGAQQRLRKTKLQIIAVPSADKGVWAYFPIYGRRRVAHKMRHKLRPTTQVLLVLSESHFEEPWRERSEGELRERLGHVLLYLRSPKGAKLLRGCRKGVARKF